jgi:hypothetical protein
MDEPLVALGAAISLVVALAGVIWWLVASARRDRRRQRIAVDYARCYLGEPGLRGRPEPAHLLRGQGEAITVAELLDQAEHATISPRSRAATQMRCRCCCRSTTK